MNYVIYTHFNNCYEYIYIPIFLTQFWHRIVQIEKMKYIQVANL